MSEPREPTDVRFVVFHRPGPKWQPGIDFREQPGVFEHVDHYRKLHAMGKLELGGPFLVPESGGLMVPVAGTPREEMQTYAEADPAVKNGLLTFEVRPWHVAMKR